MSSEDIEPWIKRVVLRSGSKDASNLNPVYVKPGGSGATVFGEALTAELTPVMQSYCHRVNDTRVWEIFSATGGSVVATDDLTAKASTGTSVGGYGVFKTKSKVVYQPGQGAGFRYTALFTTGVALSLQIAGPYTAEDGLAFGYNAVDFAIMHRYQRRLETQSLQITALSSAGGTATVTLNGAAHTVTIAAGSVQDVARDIANGPDTGTYNDGTYNYRSYQLDDIVWFQREGHGVIAGAFTYSSTGSSTGDFTQGQAGAEGSLDWINQADWNIDTLDGSADPGNPSGMNLDPTKFNVYEIRFGWLGSFPIQFYVGNQSTQEMIPVHIIEWGNTAVATSPSMHDPKFPVSFAAASLGSTTDLSVRSASVMGYIQGAFTNLGPRWTRSVDVASVGSTNAPIISIQTSPLEVLDGHISRRRVLFDEIFISNYGAKSMVVHIHKGTAQNLVGYNFQEHDSANESNVWYDTSATATTGTVVDLYIINVEPLGETRIIGIDPLEPGEVIIVTAETKSATSSIIVSIRGREDV